MRAPQRQRRETVAQSRRISERSMRDAQQKASVKRRLDTLSRASTPHERRSSKRTVLNSQPPATRPQKTEVLHAQRMEAFEMRLHDTRTHAIERLERPDDEAYDKFAWQRVYEANHHEFQMRLVSALADADAIDSRADQERLEAAARARSRIELEAHKARLFPSLLLICPQHGTGAKLRPVETSHAKSLSGYFSSSSGQMRRKTLREFQDFFASEIAYGRAHVTTWPVPAGQAEPERPDDRSAAGDPEFTCSECSGDLVLDHRTGTTACPFCGVSRVGGLGLGVQQTFADGQASSRTAAPYERISHFKEFIARLEGSERTEIPQIVVHTLLQQCMIHRIDPLREPERVTYTFVRTALQRTGYCQFFENSTQLISLLTKRQPRRFLQEEKDLLTSIFREIQAPFEKHKGKRKNFLSYSFTLYKICELLGMREMLPYLPLLKAPSNLLAADLLWEKICNDLQYEFIRTS
jgi:hypothetical protein